MAQLVISAAGAAIGFAAGGPVGAQIGWAAGSALGSFLGPKQRNEGPRLQDLKVTGSSYGQPIPWIEGHPRVAGQIIWASAKRELSTTSGGKGGPSTSNTTFTYEVDLLLLVSINEIAGVRRVWSNGQLVFTAADNASGASLSASLVQTAWREMTVYGGAASQLPDATYEASVGAGNAPAYRGRGTVMITGLNLGTSGQMPNLTFEVVRNGNAITGRVVSLLNFDGLSLAATTASYSPAWPAYPSYYQPTFADDGVIARTWTAYGFYGHGFRTSSAKTIYGAQALSMDDYASAGSFSSVSLGTPASADFACAGDFTIEFSHFPDGAAWPVSSSSILYAWCGNLSADGDWSIENISSGGRRIQFRIRESGVTTAMSAVTAGAVRHEIAVTRKSGTIRLFIDGILSATMSGSHTGALTGTRALRLLGNDVTPNEFACGVFDRWRFINGVALYDASYTVSTQSYPSVAKVGVVIAYDDPLAEVVTRQHARVGHTSAQIDVTGLSGSVVRAMAVGQVGPPRAVIENLMTAYHFEAVETGGKVKYVPRGGASAATIPYASMGASAGEPAEPLPLNLANDIEAPVQVTVRYVNVSNDYQDGSESSDRLLGPSGAVQVSEVPLGLTPQEAKTLADVTVMDVAASLRGFGPVALSLDYAHLEPSDVVTLTDSDGTAYRARILKDRTGGGIKTIEGVIEDASILTSTVATTTTGYTDSTVVAGITDTTMQLLDIPLLRDADDSAGFYAAFKGTSPWPGATLFDSVDNVTYTQDQTVSESTEIGTCTTTLGNWAGGTVFDETNSVTVNVGTQTLTSYARDDILNGTAPGYVVGSELLHARTATLVSPGVYTLSGLLRGRRGTEWAMTGHAASERFAALPPAGSGLRRVALSTTDIGVLRYYKGVTSGRALSTATAQSLACQGIGQKPFAPVDLRAARNSGGDMAFTWARRTRMNTSLFGALGTGLPLGEAAESYDIEFWDSLGTTLKRSFSGLSSASVIYSAAQQTADFGAIQTNFYPRVYQVSSAVGRGYPLLSSASNAFTPTTQTNTITLSGTFSSGVQIVVDAGTLRLATYHTVAGDVDLSGVAASLSAAINGASGFTASSVSAVITVTGPVGMTYALQVTVGGTSWIGFNLLQSASYATAGYPFTAELWINNFFNGTTEPIQPGIEFSITVERPQGAPLSRFTYTTDFLQLKFDVLLGLVNAMSAQTPLASLGYNFNTAFSDIAGYYGRFTGPIGASNVYLRPTVSAPFAIAVSLPIAAQEAVPAPRPMVLDATVIGTPAAGDVFIVILDGVTYSYTAAGGDTRLDVATGLAAAIDAAAAYVATPTGLDTARITGTTDAVPYTYNGTVTRALVATIA